MREDRLDEYLEDMMGAAKRACKFVEGMPKINFFEDEKTQQAVAMSIVIIGEIAAKINEKHADFVMAHPEIPCATVLSTRILPLIGSMFGIPFIKIFLFLLIL